MRRGIYKNKIVLLQDFRAIPPKKKNIWTLYKILPNPVNTQFSGYLLTVPYCVINAPPDFLLTWKQKKILCTSHNALFPVGYFVQIVMWVVSDEMYLN